MASSSDELRERARKALPPVEGELRIAGLKRPVEVIRDRWGVPHIYARSQADLFFAQGFVLAQERLFQMDFLLRVANGRVSTMFSQMGLDLDRFHRTVGLHRGAARLVAGYDELSREMVAASAAGIWAWIDRMPARPIEYEILDLDPYLPEKDVDAYAAAGAVFMSWNLSRNFDVEVLRAAVEEKLGREAMVALFPQTPTDPGAVVPGKLHPGGRSALELLMSAPLPPPGQGSNNWVVAGSRTVTGKPLLANDPHLQIQTPSIWFECHLAAPGYEAAGVTLPFAPGIVIGRSAHHAWGLTNTEGDVQDLFLERLNEDRTAALYEGRWEPLTVHREDIEVRGSESEVVEVAETRHGPVLDSYVVGIRQPQVVRGITETYALRWVGLEAGIQPSTLVRMAQATSFAEFREALRTWHCPGQNVVYADVEGNIGYQCTGLYPLRRKGDGTVPVPGWTSEYEWDGWIPFEELPWCENPEEGFLATANQKIHDDSYRHLIAKDFLAPHRARRIVEMITATEKHSKETFARMHADTVSLPARQVLPLLLQVEPEGERQKEALAHLEGWDRDIARDSVAACVYQAWLRHGARVLLAEPLGPELFAHYYGLRQWDNAFVFDVLPELLRYPTARWFGADGTAARDDVLRRALQAALAELETLLGEDMTAWRWGAVHKVVFAHPLALLEPELFTAGVAEMGGDEDTVSQGQIEPEAGYEVSVLSSWRQIMDLSDPDGSVGMNTTGQSGNPASPHWNDCVEPWSRIEYHPLPFTRGAVERTAEHRASLVPE